VTEKKPQDIHAFHIHVSLQTLNNFQRAQPRSERA